jgi:hypothetical protein
MRKKIGEIARDNETHDNPQKRDDERYTPLFYECQ